MKTIRKRQWFCYFLTLKAHCVYPSNRKNHWKAFYTCSKASRQVSRKNGRGKKLQQVVTGLPDENFNKKPNNAAKRDQKKAKPTVEKPTLFAVLPFLCHKKYLNNKNIKFFSSKLGLNLAWHCTGALIFSDFSWFVKLHTLGTMVSQFAYWSIGSFLHERLSHSLLPVLTIRITRALRLTYRISVAETVTCLQTLSI